MISLLKAFITQNIESKLHFQAVINIGLLFDKILRPANLI